MQVFFDRCVIFIYLFKKKSIFYFNFLPDIKQQQQGNDSRSRQKQTATCGYCHLRESESVSSSAIHPEASLPNHRMLLMRRSDAAERSCSTRGEKRPDVFCFCFYYDSILRLSIHVSKWLHSMGVLFCILTFLFWNFQISK